MDELVVPVRAQPRARKAGIQGSFIDAAGRSWLRIAVSEPPEQGRATRAVCALLAEALSVSVSQVALRSGAGAREKLLTVSGDRAVLEPRLRALMDG